MRIRKPSKRIVALAAMTAGLLVAATLAFAYFTSNGSGTGSATVGSSGTISLSSDPVNGLFPGGDPVDVTVSMGNTNPGAEYVGTITGTVDDSGACLGSWFTVAPINYNQELAAGASDTAPTTVSMTDTGDNQDACQGASLTIEWSSN